MNTRSWLAAVVLVLMGMGCATLPRPGKPAMADVNFRMREYRLANGLRVIVEEDHAAPLVGVFTVVGVGSAGDPQGKAGLAHLLEHLAFRARPGGKMTAWNQLESAGVGFLNAATSFDNTIYMEVGSKDALPKLLQLELGRMLDPLNGVDAKVFEVEREVVRNELRQRGENAIGPAFNHLQEAVFPPGHPYARPIGGSHESLSAITFDDTKKFALDHYRADNMTMLVIGDVDLEHFDQVIKQALPSPVFAPRPLTTPTPSRLKATVSEPPEPPQARLLTRQSTVAAPELYVVWSLPRAFDSETVMLDFVTAAASRELSGAFFSDPDIVSVSVFPVPGAEASMLIAVATLRKGDHVERSFEKVLDQLVKLWASGEAGREWAVDETYAAMEKERAFGRMQNSALVQMTLAAESLIARGAERAEAAHFTGDPLTYSRRLRALGGITPAQVSHFAEKYLRRDRARAVVIRPFSADDKQVAAGPAGLAPVGADALTTSLPAEKVKELGRAHLARKNETVVTAKREHLEETLPNGLKVVVQRRRDALPVAVVQLTVPVGTGGTTPLGAAELAQELARPRGHLYGNGGDFGVSWGSAVSLDRLEISAAGASGNVPNMLAQLSERVGSMRVEASELAFFKSEFADYLTAVEQLPLVKARRTLTEALFRGHPWATQASVADQKKLGAGELEGWFERALHPAGAVLVVAGDLDAEATLLEVKKWLAGWQPAKEPFVAAPRLTLRSASAPEVVVTHQAGATQAQVRLSCLADGRSLEQALAQQTLVNLLSTTLFEKIRGELGASYGFGGGVSWLVGGTSRLDWSGSVENGRLPQAMTVLKAALGQLSDGVSEQALERARWEVARESTLADSTAGAVADALTREALAGRRTDGFAAARFEALAGIGREQVLGAWGQCRGHLVMSVVGDEARIRDALKAAGL